MAKKGFFILFLQVLFASGLFGGNLDLRTRQLIDALSRTGLYKTNLNQSTELTREINQQFSIYPTPDAGWCASVFIKINPAFFNPDELSANRIQFNGEMGEIMTAQVPLSELAALEKVAGIEWVQMAQKVKFRLDVSAPEIEADKVIKGVTEVGKAFTGKGVIVGIVDSGIDIAHPDFQKTDGSTRILYLWDQNEESGDVPSGYNYGVEWTAAQINSNQCTHTDSEPHGTHVAGIAAGNGAALSKKYRGIAPEADLIIVSTRSQDTDIADGIKYIFDKATALSKPAVINLSLGVQRGPHDGKSSFDQAVNGLVGPGKIVIGAAGNEGAQYLHLTGQVSNDSLFSCFALPTDQVSDYNFIDVWGKTGSNLSLAVLAVDASKKIKYYLSSDKKDISRRHFIVNADTVATFWIGYEKNTLNNDQHYEVTFEVKPENNQYDWYVRLGGSGEFDAWTENNPSGIHFKPNKPNSFLYPVSKYKGGDNQKSVGEIGSTSPDIISVGAYTTKSQWTNYQGTIYLMDPQPAFGQIASFSSIGTTRDGRLKPELSAPGNLITAALSGNTSFDDIETSRLAYAPDLPQTTNGYLNYEGTSMAAPHVTGTVALMLEAKKTLTPADIKILLTRSARKDAFTTASVNNTWGHGKVDAYYSVKNAANYAAVQQPSEALSIKTARLIGNFPNPFNAQTQIRFELSKRGKVSLRIFDILGKQVAEPISDEFQTGVHQFNFDASRLSSGIYFYQLDFNNQLRDFKKMVLVK